MPLSEVMKGEERVIEGGGVYEKRKKKEGTEELSSSVCNTQESNPDLLHYRRILYQLSHQGLPGILDWEAYAFPKDLPNSGIELESPALQADSLPAELPEKPNFI